MFLRCAALGLALVVAGRPAHADTTFGPGSLIIPASSVYQTDCGAVAMYGLVYNVLRANAWLDANGHGTIDVYYTYRETKSSPNRCTPTNLHNGAAYSGVPSPAHDDATWNDGCDFEVFSNSVVPVTRVTNTTATNAATDATSFATISTATKTSGGTAVYPNWPARTIQHTTSAATNVTTVRYWGGSFVINDADAPTLLRLVQGTLTAYDSEGNAISFAAFRDTGSCTYGTTVGGNVTIHRAQVAFDAPTPRVFSSQPPRLALLARNANQSPLAGTSVFTAAGTNSYTGRIADTILQEYLERAGLDFTGAQGCPSGGYLASTYPALCPNGNGQIYDLFDFRDVVDGRLADTDASGAPRYKMLWAPHWELAGASPTANERAGIANIATFLDGQRGLMAECASIETFEGVASGYSAPSEADAAGQFQSCVADGASCSATSSTHGFAKNSGGLLSSSPTGVLRNCSDPDQDDGDACVYYSNPGDPFAQVADYRWHASAYSVGSHVADWKPASGRMYRPGVQPLISGVGSLDRSLLTSAAAARAMINGDFATRSYKDNDEDKSNILYLANHDLTSSVAGTKVVLQTLLQLGDPPVEPVTTEVARSTPVVVPIGGTAALVQGTFEQVTPAGTTTKILVDGDADAFRFPYLLGHMRAVPTTSISTTAATHDSLNAIFDAADEIPPVTVAGCSVPFQGSCRTVFTNTTTGVRPQRVMMSTGNVDVLGPLMAPGMTVATQQTLISRVLAGIEDTPGRFVPKLGGVDRSTVAVIPASSVAGSSSRPQMAYFGAADGMLHAVCAEVVAGTGCTKLGRELWAFIPRTLLPRLRKNTQRIEGSPRVIDLYGDFDGDGVRGFSTILLFQTGTGDPTIPDEAPSVYALDVTDPAAPTILWEYTTPSTRGALELGQGLAVNAGQITGIAKHAAFVQTNNGGTGGAGVVVTAIDVESGAELWQTGHAYPAPRDSASGNVPAAGVPGGAVAVIRTPNGKVSDVVFGTLYGDLWQLDAQNGNTRHGGPLFRFSTDKKPFGTLPTVYGDGTGALYAVGVSGGYYDPAALTLWSGTSHQLVAVSLFTPPSQSPLDETSGSPYVPIVYDLGAGERAFSQAVVIGDQLFVTTDSEDVNQEGFGTGGSDSGRLHRLDIPSGGNASSIVIAGGAGSVTSYGTELFASSKDKAVHVTTDARTTANASTNAAATPKVTRKLWLRSL